MDDPASSCLLLLQHTETTDSLTLYEAVYNIAAVVFIVGLNAFFVASEFALVSVRRTRIQKLVEEGAGGAAAVLRLLDNPTRFISAVQLGVTLASLALGWVGEPTVARFLTPVAESLAGEGSAAYIAHGGAVVIAFSIITFLHVVLGELVPKMFALEKAERFALIAARPLEWFAKVFSPILWVLNYAGRLVGRALGISASLEHT
jgi:CBS domain containing-hemolysin-like protein